MNKHILFVSIIILISISAKAQQGQWTWMNGSSTNNAPVWGTQGIFDSANTPIGLYEACQWTDSHGKFWLYGGLDSGTFNQYSDLWMFNPSINQWAWIKGPGTVQQFPVYGTQGIPDPANTPGARSFGVATWVDNNNNLWLFGGMNNQWSGTFGDLWKYEIATNQWTWMKGPEGFNYSYGSYGTKGVADTSNFPPARSETSATWTDSQNNLWLFGGNSYWGTHNDLWKYNIATNTWTWVSGSSAVNDPGHWGTMTVPDTANLPAARMVYAKWKDHAGNFWLFGGANSNSSSLGTYNDLWRYNPTTNIWTWMSGQVGLNFPGYASGYCAPSVNNKPPGRFESRACFQTYCNYDHFQFFGGGYDINASGKYNDLWDYDVSTGKWTLLSGSLTLNQAAVYGTRTVPSAANHPGSRMGSIGWVDPNTQAFWLFGGIIHWPGNHSNEMWRFVPDTACSFLCNMITDTKETIANKSEIIIYPNPFNAQTTITLNSNYQSPYLMIYNLLGQVIRTIEFGNEKQLTISREQMANGMYFYKLMDKNDVVIASGKMIVE